MGRIVCSRLRRFWLAWRMRVAERRASRTARIDLRRGLAEDLTFQ